MNHVVDEAKQYLKQVKHSIPIKVYVPLSIYVKLINCVDTLNKETIALAEEVVKTKAEVATLQLRLSKIYHEED